jgi:hypothetical protein
VGAQCRDSLYHVQDYLSKVFHILSQKMSRGLCHFTNKYYSDIIMHSWYCMIINLRLIAVLPFSMKNIVGNICLATTTLFPTHSLAAATVSHFLSP